MKGWEFIKVLSKMKNYNIETETYYMIVNDTRVYLKIMGSTKLTYLLTQSGKRILDVNDLINGSFYKDE